MLQYALDVLGWLDFERLCQALLKRQLGSGVESWGGGRGDWGRDAFYEGALRYPGKEPTHATFVFQCKFIEGANAAGAKPEWLLRFAVSRERARIANRLTSPLKALPAGSIYTLMTNALASAELREKIRAAIREILPGAQVVIQDGNDLCAWISGERAIWSAFPTILCAADLRRVIADWTEPATVKRSNFVRAQAERLSQVFVPTAAYQKARRTLRRHSFVILEGPPEVGKTAIGRMIALTQFTRGWEYWEVREAKEVTVALRANACQVFVADDFFGRGEYEPALVSAWRGELAHILPELDSRHWLILTSRNHLFTMARRDLDVDGANDRFPKLGEVVVRTAELTSEEKARILYRHAKAARLPDPKRAAVKRLAPDITHDHHFTPERIRLFVGELARSQSDPENTAAPLARSILSNPTQQMRVSFRALRPAHKWLLYAMAESDAGGGVESLEERYTRLCPPDEMLPYAQVSSELLDTFIAPVDVPFSSDQREVSWIHPSCRDMVIDELAGSPVDRRGFISHSTLNGLQLAASIGGGASGERAFPLLVSPEDMNVFAQRTLECSNSIRYELVLFLELTLARYSGEPDWRLARLQEHLRTELLPSIRPLVQSPFAQGQLPRYLELCDKLGITPPIDAILEDLKQIHFLAAQAAPSDGMEHQYLNLVSILTSKRPDVWPRVAQDAAELARRVVVAVAEEAKSVPTGHESTWTLFNTCRWLAMISEWTTGHGALFTGRDDDLASALAQSAEASGRAATKWEEAHSAAEARDFNDDRHDDEDGESGSLGPGYVDVREIFEDL